MGQYNSKSHADNTAESYQFCDNIVDDIANNNINANNNISIEAVDFAAEQGNRATPTTTTLAVTAVVSTSPSPSLNSNSERNSLCSLSSNTNNNNNSSSVNANQIIIKIQYSTMQNEQQQQQQQCESNGQRESVQLREPIATAANEWQPLVEQTVAVLEGSRNVLVSPVNMNLSMQPEMANASMSSDYCNNESVEYCEVLTEAEAEAVNVTASKGAIPKRKERKSNGQVKSTTTTTSKQNTNARASVGSATAVTATTVSGKQQGMLRNAWNRFMEPSTSKAAHKQKERKSVKAHSKQYNKCNNNNNNKSCSNSPMLRTVDGVGTAPELRRNQRNSMPAALFNKNNNNNNNGTQQMPRPFSSCTRSNITTPYHNHNCSNMSTVNNNVITNNNNNNSTAIIHANTSSMHGNNVLWSSSPASASTSSSAPQQHVVVIQPNASVLRFEHVPEDIMIWMAAKMANVTVGVAGDVINATGMPMTTAQATTTTTTPRVGPIVHSQVDFVHSLVPDLQRIFNTSYYWGKMDRYEAERLLEGKPEGTFLLRDSAQDEFLFSVTFRKYGRSLHARIEQSGQRFSFDCHDPSVYTSRTVTGLLDHYKDPSCVMFFEPMLTIPLHRKTTFSLQDLSRAAIVSHTSYDGINELELPARLKSYLKEYHYKQKLRVKPFE